MKRTLYILGGLCLVSALLLAGCNLEGVAAFSPNNDRVALVSKVGSNTNLYTTDINGAGPVKIEDNVSPLFDVSFNPFGDKLLYAGSGGICIIAATGGGRVCPVAVPSGGKAFLSFLPNGDFILAYLSGATWTMNVYNTSGAVVRTEVNIDQFFIAANAYKVKAGTDGRNGTEWYLKPYDKPSGQRNFRWVITRGVQAIMYNAAGSLDAPAPLARQINSAVQDVLKTRDQIDITSGAVSPDGTKMVFRTGNKDTLNYSLYALDLATNAGSFVQLVSNANFRVQFAFSPDGSELAYESNAGGRSVWLANADGSNPRKLADGASLPTWQP